MTLSVGLRLGPLPVPDGMVVLRSGLRWLREDGCACRPGEAIAYCNIGLGMVGAPDGAGHLPLPFADEARDFQVAFAPRVGGILRRAGGLSRGGALDQLHFCETWRADTVLGHLELPAAASDHLDAAGELRLLMLAGRRMTELAEVRSGLLTGWHDRSRAWWGDGGDAAATGTLVGLGTCEQAGILRGSGGGASHAFLELSAATPGPAAHVVLVQDEPLVPCARVLLEGMQRTPETFQAIAEDLARTFSAAPVAPTPSDWMFAGALLAGLQRSPLTEGYHLLTRRGLCRAGPADAALLTLGAELPTIFRHKRLGYAVCCHDFRLAQAGPAVLPWLRAQFEPVRRIPADIADDYRRLLAHCADSRSGNGCRPLHVLVLNQVETPSAREEVHSYAAFERPLGRTLDSIRAKELNLALHDLARERQAAVAIVDADLIAAGLGIHAHLPDGMHGSGPLHDELRGEILRILRDRRVAGFVPGRRPFDDGPAGGYRGQ